MHFTKMQGAGNDFIILDNRDGCLSAFSFPQLAAALCPRKLSIGADGLMVLQPAREEWDISMEFYNADGSLGEMCGNGARCLTRYALTHGLCREPDRVCIHTCAGTVTGYAAGNKEYTIRLNDPAVYVPNLILNAMDTDWECAYIELGHPGLPHLILPLPPSMASKQQMLFSLAKELRSHRALPKGANVNFYRLLGENAVSLYTFERGVENFTLACGTGAGCSAAHLAAAGLVKPEEIFIHAPGGTLKVSLTLSCSMNPHSSDTFCPTAGLLSGVPCSGIEIAHDIFLTGPALFVAEGDVSPDILPKRMSDLPSGIFKDST